MKPPVKPTEEQQRQVDDYTKSGQCYPFPMIRIRNDYETDKPTLDTKPEHFTDCRKDFVTFKHTTGL